MTEMYDAVSGSVTQPAYDRSDRVQPDGASPNSPTQLLMEREATTPRHASSDRPSNRAKLASGWWFWYASGDEGDTEGMEARCLRGGRDHRRRRRGDRRRDRDR